MKSTVMAVTITLMVMVTVMPIRTMQRTVTVQRTATRGILMDRAWRSTASYC
jgi:hypothetical protein